MADRNENEGVLVQVCIECGRQYMYDTQEPPPENLASDKCGNR